MTGLRPTGHRLTEAEQVYGRLWIADQDPTLTLEEVRTSETILMVNGESELSSSEEFVGESSEETSVLLGLRGSCRLHRRHGNGIATC